MYLNNLHKIYLVNDFPYLVLKTTNLKYHALIQQYTIPALLDPSEDQLDERTAETDKEETPVRKGCSCQARQILLRGVVLGKSPTGNDWGALAMFLITFRHQLGKVISMTSLPGICQASLARSA
jgi:hypothetical protein